MDQKAGSTVLRVLACVLEKLCANNNGRFEESTKVTKFHAMRPPSISIQDYLERIYKGNFVVTSLNVHRIIITSVTLAAKFFDDQYYNNAYYARVGGVPCAEMNSLELEFLFLINFSLFVSPSAYYKYYSELVNHANNALIVCEKCSAVPSL